MTPPETPRDSETLLDEISKRHSKATMGIALSVNILGLALIFGSVTQFNRDLIRVQEDYSRVQALHGEVLRIDEILTMSCWVASTTSDEYWRDRYQSYVPVLDKTLSDLIAHTPKSAHIFIEETTHANRILVDYEVEALSASSHQERNHAIELLTSPEYASQKKRYSKGMRLLDEALQKHFEELLQAEYQQIKRRELIIFIVIIGLAIFWVLIYRISARWQSATREYIQVSDQMKRALKESAASHQQLAEERSLEIQGLRRALLQAEQQERKRLGRSVHDDLQQLIVALRLKSSIYRDRAAHERERHSYQELVSLADDALSSARDLVMRLSPPGEQKSSLVEMISIMSVQFQQRYGLLVETNSTRFVEPQQLEVRQLIFRVIRELLFNIVKYAQVSRAELRLWSETDYDYFVVRDEGVGFDPDHVTNAEGFSYTGLGLSGMREQFAMVGGSVDIQSTLGAGTVIKLGMPHMLSVTETTPDESVSQEEVERVHIERALIEPVDAPPASKRILIVDDNHALRKMLIQLFQDAPEFTVVGEAASGPEAVQAIDSHEVDLLLIDYSLPGFDGAEAARLILQKKPQVRVVGFTSFDLAEVLDHFNRAGVKRVILKGSDPQHLIRSCVEVLQRVDT